MKEVEKRLASITEVNNALDLGDNIRKNRNTFDSSCFLGKSHLEDVGKQNYLVFQLVQKYFKTPINSKRIIACKSNDFIRRKY